MATLYFGYISPYSRKIRVILEEKGLDYEAVTIQAADADTSFNALNPARRVPAFVDGELTLFESNVIVEYLLKTYPQNMSTTSEPLAVAMCREEHYYSDLLILNAIETMLDSGLTLLQMRNNGISADQSEYLQREQGRIQIILDWLEERGICFELPANSRIMETGGFKGQSREVSRVELYELLRRLHGIPISSIISEYGMTEMLSQLYERTEVL